MDDLPQEMALEDPRLFQPGADPTVQTGACPPLMGSLLKDKPSKRKSPLVKGEYYSEAIALLRSLPSSTHLVWSDLEDDLEELPTSQRSKPVLYQKLKKACAEEDLDWQKFYFITIACRDMLNMIKVEDAAVLLYKLMGVQEKGASWLFYCKNYLCCNAFAQDEKSTDAITLFLSLLDCVQRGKNSQGLLPILQMKCQKVERLLEKNRGAPRIRQFMELWDKTAGNGSEDDCDGNSEEDESPSRKRRCIKAEE
ncbi:hypothetical protein THARTR1_00139 [Trichoderma harzianum]|uniref:Uncharacterized protein n=1 Tax=Trichoderma harzianum TaxID=5544 RepID=A0A2K0UQR0_TRIHA|nr:hypothetical protein THARTR1_00139 [Trichoderma harzianum]